MGVISCKEKMLTEYTPFFHIHFFFFLCVYVCFIEQQKAFNKVIRTINCFRIKVD